MKRHALLIAIGILFGLILGGVAQGASVTWTNPIKYTDGSTLVSTDIQQTRVEWGTCLNAAFDTKVGEMTVLGQVTLAQLPAISPGTYCFRAYTTAKGVESEASTVVSKVFTGTAPNSPVFTVLEQTVYSVAVDYANLVLVKSQIVGKVALGTSCGFASVPGGYNAIARTAVVWSGNNRPQYVVAKCG